MEEGDKKEGDSQGIQSDEHTQDEEKTATEADVFSFEVDPSQVRTD